MDINKISEKYKTIKSPGKPISLSNPNSNEINNLLGIIQKEDLDSKKQSKRFYIITAITAIVYFFVFIVNPDPDLTIKNRIAGSCYIISAIILAALFWNKHNRIKKIWYLSPLKTFLEEAKKRFQFWTRKQLWLIVVIVLVDIASYFSFANYFENLNYIAGIFIYQFTYFGLLTFGFLKGKKEWQRKKKPIFEKIEEMLSGFEEEN